MRSWSNVSSVEDLIKQLDGLADVEVAFATGELQRAVPAGMKTSKCGLLRSPSRSLDLWFLLIRWTLAPTCCSKTLRRQ